MSSFLFQGFVIVYDVTNRESFDKIREEWLKMTDTVGVYSSF